MLKRLQARIDARATADPATSWTAALLEKGPEKCAEKFGEEAIETVIAAIKNDKQALTHEAADLLFHLLVLLKSRGIKLEDVESALTAREARSGISEKNSRIT